MTRTLRDLAEVVAIAAFLVVAIVIVGVAGGVL